MEGRKHLKTLPQAWRPVGTEQEQGLREQKWGHGGHRTTAPFPGGRSRERGAGRGACTPPGKGSGGRADMGAGLRPGSVQTGVGVKVGGAQRPRGRLGERWGCPRLPASMEGGTEGSA